MLQISEIIFGLSETSNEDKEKWLDTYMDFMQQALSIPVKSNDFNLIAVAERCYQKLCGIV